MACPGVSTSGMRVTKRCGRVHDERVKILGAVEGILERSPAARPPHGQAPALIVGWVQMQNVELVRREEIDDPPSLFQREQRAHEIERQTAPRVPRRFEDLPGTAPRSRQHRKGRGEELGERGQPRAAPTDCTARSTTRSASIPRECRSSARTSPAGESPCSPGMPPSCLSPLASSITTAGPPDVACPAVGTSCNPVRRAISEQNHSTPGATSASARSELQTFDREPHCREPVRSEHSAHKRSRGNALLLLANALHVDSTMTPPSGPLLITAADSQEPARVRRWGSQSS